jgi:hypothetical protein
VGSYHIGFIRDESIRYWYSMVYNKKIQLSEIEMVVERRSLEEIVLAEFQIVLA